MEPAVVAHARALGRVAARAVRREARVLVAVGGRVWRGARDVAGVAAGRVGGVLQPAVVVRARAERAVARGAHRRDALVARGRAVVVLLAVGAVGEQARADRAVADAGRAAVGRVGEVHAPEHWPRRRREVAPLAVHAPVAVGRDAPREVGGGGAGRDVGHAPLAHGRAGARRVREVGAKVEGPDGGGRPGGRRGRRRRQVAGVAGRQHGCAHCGPRGMAGVDERGVEGGARLVAPALGLGLSPALPARGPEGHCRRRQPVLAPLPALRHRRDLPERPPPVLDGRRRAVCLYALAHVGQRAVRRRRDAVLLAAARAHHRREPGKGAARVRRCGRGIKAAWGLRAPAYGCSRECQAREPSVAQQRLSHALNSKPRQLASWQHRLAHAAWLVASCRHHVVGSVLLSRSM